MISWRKFKIVRFCLYAIIFMFASVELNHVYGLTDSRFHLQFFTVYVVIQAFITVYPIMLISTEE